MRAIILISIGWILCVMWTKAQQQEKVLACVRSGKSVIYCEDKVRGR